MNVQPNKLESLLHVMLIEVNVTKALPNHLFVEEPNGRKLQQLVVYYWRPKLCSSYMMVGHSCLTKERQVGRIPNEPPRQRQNPKKEVQEWKLCSPNNSRNKSIK